MMMCRHHPWIYQLKLTHSVNKPKIHLKHFRVRFLTINTDLFILAIPVSVGNSTAVIHVKQPADINSEQPDDPMSDEEQVIL